MSTINRRTMIGQGAALAALAAAGVTTWAEAATPSVDEIYRGSIVLDTLSFEKPTFDPRPALAAGLTGVVLDLDIEPRDKANAVAALDDWNKVFAASDSLFYRILKGSDFAEAKRRGKFGIVLNSEDAGILGVPMYANGPENIEALSMFYGKGLRVLQLTYTTNNGLGTGYSDAYDDGLARLGVAVVKEMNRLGMLIDTSHCSEKTTLDAIRLSSRPVAVTHGGCYSLFPDKRNKSDKVIRALADKGGYMGIYNMTLWMTAKPTSSVETIVDHIDHAVKVGGIDLVGFGSDHEVLGDHRSQAEKVKSMQEFVDRNKGWPGGEPMNGHVTASDMDGPDRLRVLAHALGRRGYRDDAIEKVLGGNFVRVFGMACG
jgi:membrane dipeptidase